MRGTNDVPDGPIAPEGSIKCFLAQQLMGFSPLKVSELWKDHLFEIPVALTLLRDTICIHERMWHIREIAFQHGGRHEPLVIIATAVLANR